MTSKLENDDFAEKHAYAAPASEPTAHFGSDQEDMGEGKTNMLHQDLKGRHMQMIAMQVQRTESSSAC